MKLKKHYVCPKCWSTQTATYDWPSWEEILAGTLDPQKPDPPKRDLRLFKQCGYCNDGTEFQEMGEIGGN